MTEAVISIGIFGNEEMCKVLRRTHSSRYLDRAISEDALCEQNTTNPFFILNI